MHLSASGKAFIHGTEKCRLVAFRPTPDDVPTIGWGRTRGVEIGDTCTQEQADQWFEEDVAEPMVVVNALNVPLSQSMFDALVSLVYNAGPGVVAANTTIGGALRRRDYYGAWGGFSLWIRQKGKPLRGLALRRSAEMTLFLSDPLP